MPKLDNVKKTLNARLEELVSDAKDIDSELREPLDPDVEERAIEMEDDEVLEGLGNAAIAEINQIREALRRIDSGTYGQCGRCGEVIDKARLKAVPHALLCIDCAAG